MPPLRRLEPPPPVRRPQPPIGIYSPGIFLLLKTGWHTVVHILVLMGKRLREFTTTADSSEESNNKKKRWGQVYTPVPLIRELLDHLPEDVWGNPELQWLDPAAGTGHFVDYVYTKLMTTLVHAFPDELQRKTHILKHMLFAVEIDPENVAILRQRFENVFEGDFLLDCDFQTPFDVIVGNPPYQGANSLDVYKGSQGRRTVWNKFIPQCLSWLKRESGYLAFITPSNWRRPESPLYSLMTRDNWLRYLRIYSEKEANTLLGEGIQTRLNLFVIQTTQRKLRTSTIVDEMGVQHDNVCVQEWPFLPNAAYAEIRPLLSPRHQTVLFHSYEHDARKLRDQKSDHFCHAVVHTQNRRGMGILYSDRASSNMKVPKVILNFNRSLYPYNDYVGEYGMSQLSFGLPLLGETLEERRLHGEAIIETLLSPAFQKIVRATKWSAFQVDYRMFRYLRVCEP